MLWWKQHISNHFSGANITDMKSYLLPTKSLNLENIVLHCSTNDLKKENSANEISNDIIEVALLWKSDNNNVLGSGIISRSDKLNAKAIELNSHLKNKCCKRNISFISNSNINPKYDCNKSGLHLNWKGTNKLVENFLFALSKFDNWHKAEVSNPNSYKNKLGSSESQQWIGKSHSCTEAFKNLANMKKTLKTYFLDI